MGKNSLRLLSVFLAAVLLCGCRGSEQPNGNQGGDTGQHSSGTVTVYSQNRYKAALQQIFSHINLTENRLQVYWTADKNAADVIITDLVDPINYGNYRQLQPETLPVQPMEQLLLTDGGRVIGLPVFLRLDGFWYDALLYENYVSAVPQSFNTWQSSALCQEYPAVCSENDINALFWAFAAPLYLQAGGTEEELARGSFHTEKLVTALEPLEKVCAEGMLKLTSDARQMFTSTRSMFWITGVERVSESYHYMSNLSSWNLGLSLPFSAQAQAVSVLRADVLLVKSTADAALTDLFLQIFFRQQTMAELSADSKMPIACKMEYAPLMVPELVQTCYTALSSPAVELRYVSCGWSGNRQEKLRSALLSLMQGKLSARQAAQQITQ